jgi:predicted ATPase/class 3 adenylate cyclase
MLTFAFTDIAGSTRLWERAPDAMREALARHDALIRTLALAHRGRVFKTVGDASYCVFEDPCDAVLAAVDIQRGLARETWPPQIGTLRIRIGVHTGEAAEAAGDYVGPTLNRVSRVMSAGHGGQILLSAATALAVRERLGGDIQLVDLGAHRLKDLLQPESIYQVAADDLANDFAPLETLDARPNNLPSQLSSFVGRERELHDVRSLLLEHRLATIVGPGGIGKTRLALQVAADSIGRYHDGVWIVRLEDTDADLAAQTIASVLHVQELPGQAADDTLLEALRDKKLFLLLDNSERIVATLARLIHRILVSCPAVCVLATSREPLHVDGEYVLRIGPMEPEAASRLFTGRAHRSAPDRRSYDEETVRRICRRLDGNPLAIEIAAARVSSFGAAELERRLQSGLTFLVSKDTAGSQRHRTIASTIEWSYRLLSPQEQRLFARVAIFDGGFTLEAAEALAPNASDEAATFDLIDALVDKSLVAAEPQADAMRYRLLELIRDYACGHLEESGECDTIAERRFDYFKRFAERWGAWADEDEEHRYLAQLEADIPNMRAALAWGLQRDDPKPAFALLQKLLPYWQLRCHIREARDWFDRALRYAVGVDEETTAGLLRRAATLATIDDDYAVARDLTRRSLESYERAGDRSGSSEALHNLAVIEDRNGNSVLAHTLYARAYEGFVATNHRVGTITALYNLGQSAMKHADPAEAARFFEQGIALCDTAADSDKRASFIMANAEVALYQQRIEEAGRLFAQALELKRELGSEFDQAEGLRGLALVHIRSSDWAGALKFAREGLAIANRLQIASLTLSFFETLAVIEWHSGRTGEAEELLAIAETLRDRTHYAYDILRELSPELEALRASLGADTYAALKERVRATDWREFAKAFDKR